LHFVKNKKSFFIAQAKAKKKLAKRQKPFKNLSSSGQNKILKDWQHKAVVKYATDCVTNRGKGAARQIMFNAIVFFCAGDKKPLFT
jgi:hypothetical protein